MSDNKQLYDELEFDDEIDFKSLEDTDYKSEENSFSEEVEDFSDDIEEITKVYGGIDEIEEEAPECPSSDIDSAESDTQTPVASQPYIEEKAEGIPEKTPDTEKNDEISSKESKNISVTRFCIINTAVSAVTFCAVAAGIALGYNYISSVEKDLEIKSAEIAELERKNEELEEEYLEAMNSFELEREEKKLTVDETEAEDGKILFYDTSVGYSWMPVLSGIKQNEYKKENFLPDNRGRLSYIESGENSSYFGIDVSSHQGDIDWQLVKEDNVEFAFLRIGYRGYGEEGKLCPDEKFVENYSAAHEVGIDLGVYFFSQAVTVDEAVEEAEYVLSLLEGRTLEYPIVFDWETIQTEDPEDIPRTEDVMPKTLTLSAIAFCETIRDAGYEAMIYTNKKLATIKYDLRQLQEYPIWLAYYDTELDYIYDFDIWQYGTGKVDGIKDEVDINIAIIK